MIRKRSDIRKDVEESSFEEKKETTYCPLI